MKPMIFRKQKPDMNGVFFVLTTVYKEPIIVSYSYVSDTVLPFGESSITVAHITHWGDRIAWPSVEIEDDESSATSSEPGDIAPLMGLLNNSSDEELDCFERYFERRRES